MATNASIKVIKSMSFKGGVRQWSNRYHFNGGTPADATHWHTLMDNVVTAEKAIYGAEITIIETVGYAAGSDVPVATKTYTTAGTKTFAAGHDRMPGEACALLRWSTSARTAKNHPKYLFNYFHDAHYDGSNTNSDVLDATQKTAIGTYATAWITGFSDGSITAVRAGPLGDLATGSVVEEFITHRDFPYTTSL